MTRFVNASLIRLMIVLMIGGALAAALRMQQTPAPAGAQIASIAAPVMEGRSAGRLFTLPSLR